MMKRIYLPFLAVVLITWTALAQTGSIPQPGLPKGNPTDLILHHTGYSIGYSKTYHIAEWVAYELSAEETRSVVKRTNRFVPDPLLSSGSATNTDYHRAGYDKGHLAPSADMCYSQQTMAESFYLSNMSPQTPAFNRGIWKQLEEQVRNWAIDEKAVYIVTGPVLTSGLPTIGPHRITVPKYFYKVILDYTQPELKSIGFIIPNEGSTLPLKHFVVSIDSVEQVTGIDFFYALPDGEEKIIERASDANQWSWKGTRSKQDKD